MKASKMRGYLEFKLYATVKAFYEDHSVKIGKSISASSVLAFPDHP
jgi:hypothetical protein